MSKKIGRRGDFVLAASCIAFLAIAAPSAFAQTTIERIAPDNTVLVIGSKNVNNFMERFQQTALWSLWQTEQLKTMRADAMKEMGEGLTKMYEELGVEEGSLAPPTGPAGLALFGVTDEETGMTQIALMGLADYGNEAAAEKMDKLVQAAFERGEEDGALEVEREDVLGRSVWSVKFVEPEPAAEEEMGDDEFGGLNQMMPDPAALIEGMKNVHYVREGNRLLVTTNLDSLTGALEKLEEEDTQKGLGQREDFRAALDKLGDSDVYAVVLTRDVMEVFGAFDPTGGMGQMFRPTIRTLFGQVDSYGYGLRVDGPAAMIEQTIAAYMPKGKQGLSALIDQPAPRGGLPAFATGQTVSYSTFSFQFSGLMDVIRKTIASNPMLQMQAGEMLPMIEETLTPILNVLGKTVHVASSVTKPLTPESQQMVFAIEVAKPQEFEDAFAGLAAQAGLEPRDFLGQRIYSMDPAMMPMGAGEPPSIGIGGGFLIIGTTPSVEQALRLTGQPGGAGLSTIDAFQRAAATLPAEPVVAWGWSDTLGVAEAAIANQRFTMQQEIEEIRAIDPEFAQDMEQEMKDAANMFDAIDFDLFRRYIGPGVWALRSVEDGFVLRSHLLAAEK